MYLLFRIFWPEYRDLSERAPLCRTVFPSEFPNRQSRNIRENDKTFLIFFTLRWYQTKVRFFKYYHENNKNVFYDTRYSTYTVCQIPTSPRFCNMHNVKQPFRLAFSAFSGFLYEPSFISALVIKSAENSLFVIMSSAIFSITELIMLRTICKKKELHNVEKNGKELVYLPPDLRSDNILANLQLTTVHHVKLCPQ